MQRQIELIEAGGSVVQETRLYDPDRHETRSMRSKEDAQDYRYFPDPDLPPLVIDADWIARVESEMPELPEAMKARFVHDYALPATDATHAHREPRARRLFRSRREGKRRRSRRSSPTGCSEKSRRRSTRPRSRLRNRRCPRRNSRGLLRRIADGTISGKIAKDVFDAMWAGEAQGENSADAIIAAKGLRQISDEGAIEKIVDDAIAANPAIVAEYKAGKEKAFNSLVGKVMAASKGKANPAQVNAMLKRKLG